MDIHVLHVFRIQFIFVFKVVPNSCKLLEYKKINVHWIRKNNLGKRIF
jgi:hypothetical protein